MNHDILNDIYVLVDRSKISNHNKELMKEELLSIMRSDLLKQNIPPPPTIPNKSEVQVLDYEKLICPLSRKPKPPDSISKYEYQEFPKSTLQKQSYDPTPNKKPIIFSIILIFFITIWIYFSTNS